MSSSMRRRRSPMGFWFIAEVLVLRVESVEPLDPQDRTPAGVTGLASDGYHTSSGHRGRSSKLPRERVRCGALTGLSDQNQMRSKPTVRADLAARESGDSVRRHDRAFAFFEGACTRHLSLAPSRKSSPRSHPARCRD